MAGGNNSGIYGLTAVQVSNGTRPKVAKVYSFPLSLSGAALSLDLTPLANLHRIENVQGIIVDNSANSAALNLTTNAGQKFYIPGSSQGITPLFLAQDNVLILNGTGTVNVTLTNFPVPCAVWNAEGAESVTITGTPTVSDPVAEGLLAMIVPGVSPVTRSIASTSTASQVLCAANPAREYLLIQSGYNSGTFYDVWVNFIGGTASVGGADCIRVPAGSFYESGTKCPLAAVSIICATQPAQINALEG